MFRERPLHGEVSEIRAEHCSEALVLDCETDFEALPSGAIDDLALVTDRIDPVSYPSQWLPESAPDILRRHAGSAFTVGLPGDGSVAWTTQTVPAVVFVKPRVEGVPEDFVDFLIAEALVEIGTEAPEDVLSFFGERYPELHDAVPLDPVSTYQIGTALRAAWVGLSTRERFSEWHGSRPRLAGAWQDAGERIEPRLGDLAGEVAHGRTDFADATELACSAIKHALEVPAPFAALDTAAYRHHGPEYAVEWARRTFEALAEE